MKVAELTDPQDKDIYRKRGVVGGLLSCASRLETLGYADEAVTLRRWVNSTLREALGMEAQTTENAR